MKKTVLVVVATAVLVSACTTTDPYTGDQKISNTAAGAGLGALAGASLG
ncbi:cell envelope biogenesis protein OmpA, partial [Mesorhizobium sp. M2A.F.Ca.ET.039.01.1.1]